MQKLNKLFQSPYYNLSTSDSNSIPFSCSGKVAFHLQISIIPYFYVTFIYCCLSFIVLFFFCEIKENRKNTCIFSQKKKILIAGLAIFKFKPDPIASPHLLQIATHVFIYWHVTQETSFILKFFQYFIS